MSEGVRVFFWAGNGVPILGVECPGRTLNEQDCMERWLIGLMNQGLTDHCKTVGEARKLLREHLCAALSDPKAFKEKEA